MTLEELLDQGIDLVCGARSGFVAGSQRDCEWEAQKAQFLRECRRLSEERTAQLSGEVTDG